MLLLLSNCSTATDWGGEHLRHTHEVELTGIGGSAFLRSLCDDLLEVHEVAVSSVPLVVVGGGRSKLVGVAQLGLHELVVAATKLLLSERGDVPCIGIPELIEVGKTGELFESGNAAQLEEKIRTLWEDRELTDRYSENCAHLRFDDVAAYTEKLLKLYRGETL